MRPLVLFHAPEPSSPYLGGARVTVACTCTLRGERRNDFTPPSQLIFERINPETNEVEDWLDANRGQMTHSGARTYYAGHFTLPKNPDGPPKQAIIRLRANFERYGHQPLDEVVKDVGIVIYSPTWTSGSWRPSYPRFGQFEPWVTIPRQTDPYERHPAGRGLYVEGRTRKLLKDRYVNVLLLNKNLWCIVDDQVATWGSATRRSHPFHTRLQIPNGDLFSEGETESPYQLVTHVRGILRGRIDETNWGPSINVFR